MIDCELFPDIENNRLGLQVVFMHLLCFIYINGTCGKAPFPWRKKIAQPSSDHVNLFKNDEYCFVSVFIIAVDHIKALSQKRFNTISFFYPLPQLFHYPRFPSSLFKIEHLYGLTVFENYLYATNSDNANMQPKTSVIRVNRFNSTDYQVVTRVDKGGALHVYHQRRQPPGRLTHTHTDTLSFLRHIWIL